MQVHIVNHDLVQSAMELPDVYLKSDIREIAQLLSIFMQKWQRENCIDRHQNHPIYKHYLGDWNNVLHLIIYWNFLLVEYHYRFGRHHMHEYTKNGMLLKFNVHNEIYCGDEWKPIYVFGKERSTENVPQLYQKLIREKSKTIKMEWTDRDVPKWFERD